jgi:hypothetical protein
MSDVPVHAQGGLTTRGRQPLIGIPTREGADEVVHYFTSEEEADRALAHSDANVELALSAIGAWSDLDFDEMLDALDRIRHQSTPTPPVDVDL